MWTHACHLFSFNIPKNINKPLVFWCFRGYGIIKWLKNWIRFFCSIRTLGRMCNWKRRLPQRHSWTFCGLILEHSYRGNISEIFRKIVKCSENQSWRRFFPGNFMNLFRDALLQNTCNLLLLQFGRLIFVFELPGKIWLSKENLTSTIEYIDSIYNKHSRNWVSFRKLIGILQSERDSRSLAVSYVKVWAK